MIRDYFRTHRFHVMIAVLAVAVLAVVVLWMAAAYLRPMPPRTLIMATGPEGGAYHEFGKRYREILARDGIELRLLPTAGALENLEAVLPALSHALDKIQGDPSECAKR